MSFATTRDLPRKTDPTPENLARKTMARQPTGASGKKVKLRESSACSRLRKIVKA